MVVVFLVDKGGGDPTSARVQILLRKDELGVCVCVCNRQVVVAASLADLVRAPAGEVDAPVVQLQLNVSGGVRTIKTHETTLKKKRKVASEKRLMEMVVGHRSPSCVRPR